MASRFTPRSAILALAVLTTALTMSCGRDQITTPQAAGIHAPTRANHDLDPAAESPALASATVAATGIDIMPNQRAKIGSYPSRTIVELLITQSITISPLVSGLTGGSLPLGGRLSVGCTGQARVESADFNPFDACALWNLGAGGATSWTDTISVYQDAYIVHTTDSPGFGSCSSNCYEYSGSTSATLRRVDANFAITAGSVHGVFLDSATVNAGEWVTFGMRATPQRIHDYAVSAIVDPSQWRFVADDGEVTGCPNISGGYCNIVMTKSGTMHVSGYVNGAYKPEARAVHVTVLTPQLRVSCNPVNPSVPLIRGMGVVCTATTSDSSASFTVKHLKSTAAGGDVLFDQDISVPQGKSFGWPGTAVVSSQVEVTAAVGGKDTVATGSFTVQSRIGQVAGFMDEDFPDTQFPVAPPSPAYAKTMPPFTVAYPGFVIGNDSVLAGEGALGVTIFIYPQAPVFQQVGSGPNTGVIYVTSVPWVADERYSGFGVGIYLEQSTLSSDPFFKKQKGPAPKCTQADMAQIHSVLLAHEQRHWTTLRPKIAGINYVRTLDSLMVLPGRDPAVAGAVQLQLREAYRDSVNTANNVTHAFNDIYPDCQVK